MVAIVIGGGSGPEAWEAAHAASFHFDRVLVLAAGPDPAEASREAVSRRTRTWVRPNIEVWEDWTAEALCVTIDGRIFGVSVRNRSTGKTCELLANLVVEASGESSCLPEWLGAAGLATPARVASSVAGFEGWQWRYDKIGMPLGLVALGQAVRRFGDPGRDLAFALSGARLLGQCLAEGNIHAFQRRLARLVKQEEAVVRPAWTVRLRATLSGGHRAPDDHTSAPSASASENSLQSFVTFRP